MNIYYYIVKITEDDGIITTYHGFTSAESYRDAMNYLMDNMFNASQCIDSITMQEFYETDMLVSEETANRIIEDLAKYPVYKEEKQ